MLLASYDPHSPAYDLTPAELLAHVNPVMATPLDAIVDLPDFIPSLEDGRPWIGCTAHLASIAGPAAVAGAALVLLAAPRSLFGHLPSSA